MVAANQIDASMSVEYRCELLEIMVIRRKSSSNEQSFLTLESEDVSKVRLFNAKLALRSPVSPSHWETMCFALRVEDDNVAIGEFRLLSITRYSSLSLMSCPLRCRTSATRKLCFVLESRPLASRSPLTMIFLRASGAILQIVS